LVESFEPDGDCTRPWALVHHDDGFDDTVGGFAGDDVAQGERRSPWRLALDPARTRGEHDPLREVAVDVVGDPARELVEVACAGEHLDDAMRQVAEQGLGLWKFAAACGLTAEVLVFVVEELCGGTSYNRACDGRACGHLCSMRGRVGLQDDDGITPERGTFGRALTERYSCGPNGVKRFRRLWKTIGQRRAPR
jgi:hypothetical protein